MWNKNIIDPSPPWFGLDISELTLKAVYIDRRGKYTHVRGVGSVRTPEGAIADGVVVNPDALVEAVKTIKEKSGIKLSHVVCSLPETKAFLRIISIPQMTEQEVAEAVKWEMEANIPMTIDQVYYDWQVLPADFNKEAGKMSVLVVAVARTVIDAFSDVLERAGLTVRGFEVESMAQARSLLAEDLNDTTMIVDIGDSRTSFLVVARGIPVFTSSIPLCAESMTDAISKGLGLTKAEAEKAKIEYGIGSVLKNDHIYQSMEPVLNGFIMEINKSLNFYLTGLKYTESVDRVVLCGGGSKTKGIIPYFSRRLSRDITLGDPWVNMHFKGVPQINRQASAQYATAIGLAIKPLTF